MDATSQFGYIVDGHGGEERIAVRAGGSELPVDADQGGQHESGLAEGGEHGEALLEGELHPSGSRKHAPEQDAQQVQIVGGGIPQGWRRGGGSLRG